ncbi:MAG TPA: SH3 domain-containing protein [Candidatus Babeliales bacterium]|nr:SH3 domain-containing protein [Candidatus Babeliales bacterium]
MVIAPSRISLIFVLFYSAIAYAVQNDQEIFLQARRRYFQNEPQKAFELYTSIEKKGDAVWFNSGACLLALNKQAEALAYWYRARKEASFVSLPFIDHAISNLEKTLNDNSRTNVDSRWQFFERTSLLFSLGTWQLLFLSVLFLFGFCVFYASRMKKIVLVFFAIVLLLLAVLIFAANRLKTSSIGIVAQEEATIRIAPDESFDQACLLPYGSSAQILQKEGQWYKIRHHTCVGWVNIADVVRAQ